MRPNIHILEESSPSPLPQTNVRLEIIIVCLSYAFTVISVFLKFAARVNPREPLTAPIGSLLTIFTISVISLASLVMASASVISLDAMAIATIGLLPALDSFRHINFTELRLRWHVFRIVYGGTDGIFFFYQLSANIKSTRELLSTNILQIVFYPYQTALTRRVQRFRGLLSLSSFSHVQKPATNLSRFLRNESCVQKYEVLDTDEFWAAQQTDAANQPSAAPERKLLVIRQYGSTWFAVEKILAGHFLLREPSKVYAANRDSVLKALSALTEIVLIGDLCRLFCGEEIRRDYRMIRDKKNHQAVMSFCNETFRQLGLDKLWQFSVSEHEESLPKCASQRFVLYRNLFIVLTFHSKLFLQVTSSHTNVHDALRSGANGEPLHVLRQCVCRWLRSYGYNLDLSGVGVCC